MPTDIATLARAGGTVHKFLRLMEKDGLKSEAFRLALDDKSVRTELVKYWNEFLSSPERLARVGGLALSRAIKILGDQKIISVGQAAVAQGKDTFDPSCPIRYTEEALREADEENHGGRADWHLVYVFGSSLRELRAHFGTHAARQPCFWENDWWLKSEHDHWAERKPESGYYLLNLRGRFVSKTWDSQEEEVKKLGESYVRADEAVLSEAAFTIFEVVGGWVLRDWYHWGPSRVSNSHRVCVGYRDRLGWRVDGSHPSNLGSKWRMVVARKWDF